ncbi:IclR family transcriptional regulator [Microbacterium kribbense]|uniref:IclR family transcriptional regulator n=1 Tax=Microbacterium kribbense TaxID=433645 RepID=A0ABP7GTA9_9MICO
MDASDRTYRPRTVHAVSHAVALLRMIAAAPTPLTLSALARKAGLSKPSTYNLLTTLVQQRLVVRGTDRRYAADWGLFELGSRVAEAAALRRAVGASLDALAADGAVLLSVLDHESVLYVQRFQTSDAFEMVANVGRRSPLHTTASGKVFLSAMPQRGLVSYLHQPLAAPTRASITDPTRLMRELVKAKDDGYTVCWGEQEPLLSSVAVPVRSVDGSVRACLAIAVATARLRQIAPSRLSVRMRDAAAGIGRVLDLQR